ncbi:MAG TPA: Ycf66 family protein [Allocoleopsis sp.]
MVNLGLNFASILGIILAIAGAGLYFLRSIRPELSRDHDIFFAAIGLLCGFILVFQGWRLDPILQFGQLLLAGTAVFFAWESIKLRGVTTEQAKRGTGTNNERTPDEERRPSSNSRVYRTKVYRDEYEELEPLEERPVTRRIRGTQEGNRSGRNFNPEEEEPIKPRERRRSRPSNQDWEDDNNSWDDNPPPSPSSRRKRPRNEDEEMITPPRGKRSRNTNPETPVSPKRRRNIEEPTSTDYVEFKPIDDIGEES